MTLLERLRDLVGRRPRLALALAVAVPLLAHSPSLSWGFFADDYSHQAVLEGFAESETLRPWNLYDFGERGPDGAADAQGTFPWWTSPDWKVRFLRPVTSLVLWLDHALHGDVAIAYHVTGLALFGLLLLLLHRLYRALGLASPAALLGVLLFGLEDGGVTAVGWIANRNTLLEALFTAGALVVLARSPRPAAPRPLAAALGLSVLAMLSKESGIGAALLVAGFFLLGPRRPGTSARVRAATAALLLGAAYVAVLLGLGYGARGPFYPTPWTAPALFLQRVGALLATAPLAMTAPVPLDLAAHHTAFLLPMVLLGLALGLPLVAVVLSSVRDHPAAPLLALWACATLLPRGGAPLSDRLLFVPMVGTAGLLGLFVARAWSRTRAQRLVARGVVLGAIVLSGGALVARGASLAEIARLARAMVVQAEVGPPTLGRRDVLLLQTPSAIAALNPLAVWVVETRDRDVRFWPLQMGRRPLAWTRLGPRTFELESRDGPFASNLFESVFLARVPAFAEGHRWTTARFEVEALAVEAGAPRRIRITLAEPPGPALAFLTWRGGRLARIEPPAVGATVELPAPDPLLPLVP